MLSMLQVDIDIAPLWPPDTDWREVAQQAMRATLALTPLAALEAHAPQVALQMTNSTEIQHLNKQWRRCDYPTNVLAFPQWQAHQIQHRAATSPPLSATAATATAPDFLLGDIVLAYEVCESEAKAKHIDLADHASHLIVHGFLHLLGYDHQTDSSEQAMQAIEIKALAKLAIGNPYMEKTI